MIQMENSKGLAEMIGVVVMFMIIVMMGLYFFSLNALADNTQSVTQSQTVSYQSDNIRLRSSISRLMVDKVWRADSVDYGEYGDQEGYSVISKFLSSEQGEDLWLNGTSVDYSEAKSDISNYVETTMDQSYGNRPYRVELLNATGLEISVGDVSGANRVSYPIALQSGREGRITIYVESGGVLYVR